MFESLTRYLPEIEKAESFGEWIVDDESKGTLDDPIRMPYMNNSALAQDATQAIYDFQGAHAAVVGTADLARKVCQHDIHTTNQKSTADMF